MPNGPRLLLDNALYHVRVRGNRKQAVFIREDDYKEYIYRIRLYKQKYGFSLYGYCLMPNHIHLVVYVEKAVHLSGFMHGLNRSYTAYFNEEYEKVGHLWQGRFKSSVIVKDRYVVNAINYIELNPVRAGLVEQPGDYLWSSYRERVLGLINGKPLLDGISL